MTDYKEVQELKSAPKKKGAAKASKKVKAKAQPSDEGSIPSSSTKPIKRDYTIRYGVLPSNEISNSILVKNPEYGIPIGEYGSRPLTPSASQRKGNGGFYIKLEQSIKKEGVRNPILCKSIPEGIFSVYGASRLWIAKKLKLETAFIIADYTGEYAHLEELKTKEDVLAKFIDKPAVLELNNKDIVIQGCDNP